MRAKKFDGSDPITVSAFMVSFQDACDINGISEGSDFWLIQYFCRDQAQAALQSRLSGNGGSRERRSRKRSERLRNYCEVVNYLLLTYATDDHIAETDADIRAYRQQSNQTELQHCQKLWAKALRFGTVYDEKTLQGIFIEGLNSSVRSNVRQYWSQHPDADNGTIARYAASLTPFRPNTILSRPKTDRSTRTILISRSTPIHTVEMDNPDGTLEAVLSINTATTGP